MSDKKQERIAGNIYFPESVLKKGLIFKDTDEILTVVREEAQRRGMQPCFQLRESSENYAKFVCNSCCAYFTFKRKSGGLQIVLSSVHHTHDIVSVSKEKSPIVRQPIQTGAKICASVDIATSSTRSVSSVQVSPMKSGEQRDETGSGGQCLQLQNWAHLNDCEFNIHQQCASNKSFNTTAVFTDPDMKATYQKYGDLLLFDLFEGLLEKNTESEFQAVGIFSVEDSNLRPLMVGIALISSRSSQSVRWAIQNFLSLNSKQPKSILTDYNLQIEIAIESLQEDKLLSASHLLSPRHFLDSCWEKLQGRSNEVVDAVYELTKFVTTRNSHEYRQLIKSLQCKPTTWEIVKDILAFYPQVPYCGHSQYVGLGRDSLRTLRESVRTHFKTEREAIDLLDRFLTVSSQLSILSSSSFQRFADAVDKQFRDPALSPLLTLFERKVVERFLENYVQGLRQYVVCVEESTVEGTRCFTVQSTANSTTYLVRDWQCECEQLERTGVACPHVILLANLTGERAYESLINRRWTKSGM